MVTFITPAEMSRFMIVQADAGLMGLKPFMTFL